MKGVLRMRQSLTVRRAEHFGINRKIIANMTAQSWHDIPHVVVTNEPEASEFLKVFKGINEGRAKEDKITLNAVILKVITEALKKCPRDECTYRFQTPPCPRMRDGVRRNKYLDAHASRLR